MNAYQQAIKDKIDKGGKWLLLRPRCNGRKLVSHYFLNEDHSYRPCGVMEWANQFETMDRRIAEDFCNNGYRVSTVWMGISPHFYEGPPLVFETMIFEYGNSIYCTRCSTWDQAKQQHELALKWIEGGCKEDDDL